MKSARINFGIPESEYIMEVDDSGAATSLVNQDTGTEYVGGGGGDSDFSTAKITVINNSNDVVIISAPILYKDEEYDFVDAVFEVEQGDTSVGDILLYKGAIQIYTTASISAVSGSIEDYEEGYFGVTGDCTITISSDT